MARVKNEFCYVCQREAPAQKRFGGNLEGHDLDKHAAAAAAKELERKRKLYRQATTDGRTVEQAVELVRARIAGGNVRGLKHVSDAGAGSYTYAEWERGWGVGCTLNVNLEADWDSKVVNPDNERQCVHFYVAKVSVNWSSTGRDVPTALACVALYRDVTELAAEIQSVLGEQRIRRPWDLDKGGSVEENATEEFDGGRLER